MMNVLVKRLTDSAILPVKGSLEAACFDLHVDSVIRDARGWHVQTGIAVALPPGNVMLIFPRSGLSTKLGLILRNTIGVIDSDYRGEILLKFAPGFTSAQDDVMVALKPGSRVAQAMILQLPAVVLQEVSELPETDRGVGGFGSTGV